MNLSVPPHMVALLALTSLSSFGAEFPATPTAPSPAETSTSRHFITLAAKHPGDQATAAFNASISIPRALPVVTAAPKAKRVGHLEVRRELVSFHPITVKNGPQPYVIDPDSLQKGLALVSELYRKSGRR